MMLQAYRFSPTKVRWGTPLLAVAAAALLALLAYLTSEHVLSVLAVLISCVTAIPLLLRAERDLFAPWIYTCYYVALNVLLRSVFIDFGITGESDLDYIFYLGKPSEFLVQSTGVLLLGFFFLTLGYLWAPDRRLPLPQRIFRSDRYHPRRLRLALGLMLVAAFAALVAFIGLTFGGVTEFAIGMLSRHRGLSDDLEEYRAYGYLRLIIGLSNIVVYLAYARLKTSNDSRGYYRWMLVVGMLVSVGMAFYSQGRAALVFVFLNLVFIKYYLDKRRFPWRVFALTAPVAIVLFVVTSGLRGGSGVDLTTGLTPMKVVGPIVLNNGGIDASKTGHVIDYVDDSQDYQFGATLVQFVIAVVPRQLWPTKPTNLDTYVGEKIYGAETYGAQAVPPGFFGEMYMNFWYAGIVLGAFALGALLKQIQNLHCANRGSTGFVLVYVVALQQIGIGMLGSGFSSTLMGALMAGVPLILVLYFITPRRVAAVGNTVAAGASAGAAAR